MRCDYQYRIVYVDPVEKEQYSFTSCKYFSNAESALNNFTKHMKLPVSCVSDCYRLIKNKIEPIEQWEQ